MLASTGSPIAPSVIDRTVELVSELGAGRPTQVVVISGEASCGIARQAVGELALLRDGVKLVVGSEVAVVRSIALLGEGDACLVVDLRRYDRWVLDAAKRAGRGPP
jgi:DNA-binding MurR/RpiR family transcriptional regulator